MPDREKVIAGLTMLVDRTNDDTCEGLKCCKIAEDALALLKEQEPITGCVIGILDSDDGNTCSVDFGKNGIAYDIPKEIVTLHVEVE